MQLLLSATSVLGAIVRTLPNFLSSSASDIILKVSARRREEWEEGYFKHIHYAVQVCYPGMVGGGEDLTKLEKCSAEVRYVHLRQYIYGISVYRKVDKCHSRTATVEPLNADTFGTSE